jgi:hypothetical protein
MKMQGIKFAVQWIADNDEPGDRDVESVAGYTSTILVADLFEKDRFDIARRIVRAREDDEWKGEL